LAQRQVALWDGVRNYQARNFLRQMKNGDLAFFYHSNCKVAGIVGLMRIAKEGYDDPTQFDPEHKYYDPKSTLDKPRWTGVDVEFIEKFKDTLSLTELKTMLELADLALVRQGNRLSLMPVSEAQWQAILAKCQRV
ncbi:MAG TPA: EVE domain-containing protein, partial [Agitococcus sp.]|nr:EVE domain-containing protein [Agitococcus sp.]